MKKVLYLIKSFDLGGAERFTLSLANYFVNNYKVYIYSKSGWFNEQLSDKIVFFNSSSPSISFNYAPFWITELKKLIEKEKFNLIHVQHRIFFPFINLINSKIPIIYTAHNPFNDIKQFFVRANYAVGVSKFIQNELLKYSGNYSDGVLNIYNGVSIKAVYKNNYENKVIGYLGRITTQKGIIKLVNKFENYFPSTIIIKGKLNTKYFNERKNLIFMSHKIDNEVFWDKITFFILPTYLNEGLPYSLIEAMARGKIVLSYNFNGLTELIEDGINGFIIDEKDALQEIMKIIQISEEKLKIISKNAVETILNKFTEEKMLENYLELYNKLIS